MVIREQVRKVIHAILCAKDSIGVAMSAEPHAALAWAGVLFVLPVSTSTHRKNDRILHFGSNVTFISCA